MIVLGIETSCDETAVSLLKFKKTKKEIKFKILSDNTFSQIEIHKKYGGVFPSLAKREHSKNLLPLFEKTLKESKLFKEERKEQQISPKKIKKIRKILDHEKDLQESILPFFKKVKKPKIDLISVTYGPGLEPALWVGLNFAKALSYFWNIPLFPANHMEGHIFSSFIPEDITIPTKNFIALKKIPLPAIALLVSGGHTELVLIKKWFSYKVLGQTRDDACGEAFDKVARLLGLPYPGGPEISKLASLTKESIYFPRPMIKSENFDFSFSGLKTAVLYFLKKQKKIDEELKKKVARGFEEAVCDVLVTKTLRVIKKYNALSLIIGGGVSANESLRKKLNKICIENNVNFYFPSKRLSLDNSIMIAIAGYLKSSVSKKAKIFPRVKACGILRLS